MKNENLNQTITETLELCLGKMSEKLKNGFDPDDKNSIKLLQQFRSTLSTLRSWVKYASTSVGSAIDNVKKAVNNPNNKTTEKNDSSILEKFPMSKEHKRIMTLMNQPSALYCSPAKGT